MSCQSWWATPATKPSTSPRSGARSLMTSAGMWQKSRSAARRGRNSRQLLLSLPSLLFLMRQRPGLRRTRRLQVSFCIQLYTNIVYYNSTTRFWASFWSGVATLKCMHKVWQIGLKHLRNLSFVAVSLQGTCPLSTDMTLRGI